MLPFMSDSQVRVELAKLSKEFEDCATGETHKEARTSLLGLSELLAKISMSDIELPSTAFESLPRVRMASKVCREVLPLLSKKEGEDARPYHEDLTKKLDEISSETEKALNQDAFILERINLL